MKKIIITDINVKDIRFPTSRDFTGSDAMHKDPDYSAAYVILHTNEAGLEGHGLTFTLGRGTEVCVLAIEALKKLIIGSNLEEITRDMGNFWMHVIGDSQLRWLGPEKGVIHLATAALINAVWDLWAKIEKKPLWRLIADFSPQEFVRCVPFKYITDAITPDEALDILQKKASGKQKRIRFLLKNGYPAYSTAAGWLGYPDDKLRHLCEKFVGEGWNHLKLKVGANLEDDIRRCRIAREILGPDRFLMIDANQIWNVDQAIPWINALKQFNPWWIEEPTSPDDILGHAKIRKAVKPVKVATGEHCQNRVMFKQFFQARGIDFCQLDSCRLGGVNEILAVLLMAAKFKIPVCPHAGGVGLCNYVQHLSMIDYICVSASTHHRVIEYIDHLQQHFLHPVVVKNGRYMPPQDPGYSITMKPQTLMDYEFPNGKIWKIT